MSVMAVPLTVNESFTVRSSASTWSRIAFCGLVYPSARATSFPTSQGSPSISTARMAPNSGFLKISIWFMSFLLWHEKARLLPAACVHIVIHLCGVIIADGGGSIEQDGQQILLHVTDLGDVFLHTVHHKPDMLTGQLQNPCAHDLVGKVAASDPGGFPLGADS